MKRKKTIRLPCTASWESILFRSILFQWLFKLRPSQSAPKQYPNQCGCPAPSWHGYIIDSVLPGTHPFESPEPPLPPAVTPCLHSPICSLFLRPAGSETRAHAHSMREGSLPLNTAFSGSQPLAQNTAGTLRPYCRPTLPIVRTFPLVLIGQESRVFTWRKLTPDFLQKYTKETIKDVAGRPHKYSGSCLRRII